MGLPGRWYVVGISAEGEGEGEILCVVRRLGGESTDFSSKFNYRCTGFQVFRVELSTNSWTMVKDIGNIALFLGHSSSFCIKADISRCIKANCIYFTDDCQEAYWDVRKGGGKDTGIYNIQDDTFLPYSWGISCNRLNPPMWIEQ
ncbi:F-box protein [Melia azedarach]|uniref:F-box protein n=1 Tax=Melia azedarach TaxID=155640 RepID=A0ACC1Y7J5_MELAZ|nr:F-box protein [Melia azedarach]